MRSDIKIRLRGEFSDKPIVDVAINLKHYDFPQDAIVYIEPQAKTRFMRIPIGKVSNNVRLSNIELTEFDDADGLDFRVKVVNDHYGLLLGIAENIKPFDKNDELDNNQKSILPVSSVDLSSYGVLWRIRWEDHKTVLEIERSLGSRDQVVRSLTFKAFVFPAAMTQILSRIVYGEWDPELSDPQEPSTQWLSFANDIGAGLPDSKADVHEDWIENAVRILTNRIGVREQVIEDYSKGAWK